MKKYRRVEINAYRRRVTIVSGVSGEWPRDGFDVPPAETTNEVSLDDSDSCEPVAPDSPEGQVILVEAVRSLEQRLSPEGRALLCAGEDRTAPNGSETGFSFKLRSFCQLVCPKALRFARKEK